MTWIVYQHKNLLTEKSYVGMTKKGIDKRWAEHVSLSNDKRLSSKFRKCYFHNAIKKYGIDSWEHLILSDNIETEEDALQIEMKFISDLGTLSPNGYNETHGGKGVKLTQEGKERHKLATKEALARPDVRQRYLDGIRKSHSTPEFLENNRTAQKIAQNKPDVKDKKRAKMFEYYSKNKSASSKRVEQLTKNWESIKVFESAKLAHKETGVNYTKITEVARGTRQFSGGYRWRYIDLENSEQEIKNV